MNFYGILFILLQILIKLEHRHSVTRILTCMDVSTSKGYFTRDPVTKRYIGLRTFIRMRRLGLSCVQLRLSWFVVRSTLL
jgi:hypothetical protein